jgi:hypothetical protein
MNLFGTFDTMPNRVTIEYIAPLALIASRAPRRVQSRRIHGQSIDKTASH